MSLIEFSARKQTELFSHLKQRKFNGQLLLTDSQKREWSFYLSQGDIFHIAGGIHPVRRWQRNLALAISPPPNIPAQPSVWQNSSTIAASESLQLGWEYQLLCYWIARGELSTEQATKILWFNLVEVFFDLGQSGAISYQLREDVSLLPRLTAIEAEGAIAVSQRIWHSWQAAQTSQFSPHMALAIENREKLKQNFAEQQYQSLIKLANGKYPLHDLAVRLKRDLVTLLRLFLPYIESNTMKLVEIDDLPSPVPPATPMVSETASTPKTRQKHPQQPLIACIDDSPLICYFMETIITKANCRFVAVNNPLKAVEVLTQDQPDLIFLDLVMPKIDGYEICTQLRKIPQFRRTPIVILTGNDGIVDRFRAKLVGASGYINKPVKAEVVLGIIRKHLKISIDDSQVALSN
jgi:two-component system, chemotaxis family, response regulator PixG